MKTSGDIIIHVMAAITATLHDNKSIQLQLHSEACIISRFYDQKIFLESFPFSPKCENQDVIMVTLLWVLQS